MMTPGTRFGYLVVTGEDSKRRNRTTQYRCLCACGKTTVQRASDLRNGLVKSCGCIGALGRQAARNAARITAAFLADERAREKADKRAAQDEALRVLYGIAA